MRGKIHGFDDLGHSVRIIAATGRPTGRRKSKFYDDRSGEPGHYGGALSNNMGEMMYFCTWWGCSKQPHGGGDVLLHLVGVL